MKKRLIFGVLGKFMLIEAVLLLLPAVVALIYGEFGDMRCFLITAAISGIIGGLLMLTRPESSAMYAKEGLMIIGLVWVAWSLVGALPFFISREIPRYIDALFETVSGFSTTGATILTDIEAVSKSMLFWRSFTHWVGGMGVLMFAMAISTVGDKNAIHLMRAEVAGPSVSKLVPRGTRNAKILYGIYIGLCILEFVFLLLGGMSPYDSIIHTFSTAGTGGFSSKNASIGAFGSAYIEWVIIVFMFLFSINFNLFYFMLIGKFASAYKNSEWKVFVGIVIAAVTAITISIYRLYPTLGEAIRTSVFQTVSIISTTGFGTADFEQWGGFAKAIISVLMIMGACAGSTGGGIKVARVIILCKIAAKSVRSMMHPNSVINVKVDGRVIGSDMSHAVSNYIVLYVGVFVVSLLIVAANGMTFEESFSSILTCINNIGPGFGSLGPTGNFSSLSDISKLVLSLNMLIGRLEIYPILLLFVPSIWRKKFI